jgi:predicted ester cyclase
MRAMIHGVHTGTFIGVLATGKTITYQAMAMYRIASGKMAEEWTRLDSVSVMRQLGFLPPPSG